MRKFSEHLPSHTLGLWGDERSNALEGRLYFEGKPWKVPAAVIAKLKEATRDERSILHKYYGNQKQ